MKTVELRPLDEADTHIYVSAHEYGVQSKFNTQQIAQIFRHTDGVPVRIDSVLRNIQFIGTSELHTLNTDVAGKAASDISYAPGLGEAIIEMKMSPNPATKQAFELLKVLTIFPRGELLGTIKRFNHAKPFYIQDASALMDLALIDMVEIPSVHASVFTGDGARAMLVRRPVREYLYSFISESDRKRLNNNALNLYFGSEWGEKGIKSPKTHRFDDRTCGSWKIGNANIMVLRAAREAVDSRSKSNGLKKSLELANAYCSAIIKGDHFIGVVNLCADIIPLFESVDSINLDLTLLQAHYGCALRMTGDFEKSRSVLQSINMRLVSKGLSQSILLDLALVCKKLGDVDASVVAATKIVELNPKSNFALQAQALLAVINPEESSRDKKLLEIEAKALKQGAFVVKHNLELDRASASVNLSERKIILERVIDSARKCRDHYNGMRATLILAKLTLDTGSDLDSAQLNSIVAAYHYLYSDGSGGLFNSCHDILWRSFLLSNETDNLLRLFRHSSLIWRLRGHEGAESKYLKSIASRIDSGAPIQRTLLQRELNYFYVRAGHFIKNVPA